MRCGVVADIHANLHALEAVLAALGRAGVERYLCAGDLVGYGPRPNECVARVAGLDAVTVAGNHDLIALGRLDSSGLGPLPARTLEWTVDALDDASRRFLESLPLRASVDGVVIAHGSLDDPSEYVRDCGVLAGLDADARGLIL